jgi:hypothetical protein
MPAALRHLSVVDNTFFVSNVEMQPSVPDWSFKVGEDTLPNDVRVPRPVMKDWIYLPFTLSRPRFEGPLFGRLAGRQDPFPVQQVGLGWQLDLQVQQSWRRLEVSLYDVIDKLLDASGGHHLTMDTSAFRLPSGFGYMRAHRDAHTARRQALRSRDAFLPLMAFVSFAIALPGNQGPDRIPLWYTKLVADGRVSVQWLEHLRNSQVADFRADRVGVYVDTMTLDVDMLYIDLYIRFNVPVWFSLRDGRTNFSETKWANRFMPTDSEILAAQENAAREAFFRSMPIVLDAEAPPPSFSLNAEAPSPSPPPSLYDDDPEARAEIAQRAAKVLEEFLETRRQKNKLWRASETEEQRIVRKAREANAERQAAPSTGGRTTVYEWSLEYGTLVRKPITRIEAQEVWSSYAHTQRRYDGFRDQWDLSEYFDWSAPSQQDLDDGYVGLGYDRVEEHKELKKHRAPFAEDLQLALQDRRVTSTDVSLGEYEDLLERLYYRYGFVDPVASRTRAPAIEDKEWTSTCRNLNALPQSSSVRVACRASIRDFVNGMLANPPSIPTELWDLDAQNHDLVRPTHNPEIVVSKKQSGDRLVYEIVHVAADTVTPWQLFVDDASTALECVRRKAGPSLRDVAKTLLKSGVPLGTWVHRSETVPSPQPGPEPSHFGLGWRPADHKFTSLDYASYEALRDEFLRQPHARAALLMGGIVWRIAIEVLGVDPGLAVPSAKAHHSGRVLEFSDSQLVDDVLSEKELDLICGVYDVYTGGFVRLLPSLCFANTSQAKDNKCRSRPGGLSRAHGRLVV